MGWETIFRGVEMTDKKFAKWIKGFQSDLTLRQKEVIARLAYLRCRQYYEGNKIMKIQLRKEDEIRC